jgi:hypothetical protein
LQDHPAFGNERLRRQIVGRLPNPHTEQLHVVERYRIIEGGKAIEAVAHVEDPGVFTMPWTPTLSPRRAKEVCAENSIEPISLIAFF